MVGKPPTNWAMGQNVNMTGLQMGTRLNWSAISMPSTEFEAQLGESEEQTLARFTIFPLKFDQEKHGGTEILGLDSALQDILAEEDCDVYMEDEPESRLERRSFKGGVSLAEISIARKLLLGLKGREKTPRAIRKHARSFSNPSNEAVALSVDREDQARVTNSLVRWSFDTATSPRSGSFFKVEGTTFTTRRGGLCAIISGIPATFTK